MFEEQEVILTVHLRSLRFFLGQAFSAKSKGEQKDIVCNKIV